MDRRKASQQAKNCKVHQLQPWCWTRVRGKKLKSRPMQCHWSNESVIDGMKREALSKRPHVKRRPLCVEVALHSFSSQGPQRGRSSGSSSLFARVLLRPQCHADLLLLRKGSHNFCPARSSLSPAQRIERIPDTVNQKEAKQLTVRGPMPAPRQLLCHSTCCVSVEVSLVSSRK